MIPHLSVVSLQEIPETPAIHGDGTITTETHRGRKHGDLDAPWTPTAVVGATSVAIVSAIVATVTAVVSTDVVEADSVVIVAVSEATEMIVIAVVVSIVVVSAAIVALHATAVSTEHAISNDHLHAVLIVAEMMAAVGDVDRRHLSKI